MTKLVIFDLVEHLLNLYRIWRRVRIMLYGDMGIRHMNCLLFVISWETELTSCLNGHCRRQNARTRIC